MIKNISNVSNFEKREDIEDLKIKEIKFKTFIINTKELTDYIKLIADTEYLTSITIKNMLNKTLEEFKNENQETLEDEIKD